jgi:Thoeris protein ThsA, Macro domain
MKLFYDSITSKAYWQYALFSPTGVASFLTTFGALWLVVESLDFFGLYKQSEYPIYAFPVFVLAAFLISVFFRRPLRSVRVQFPNKDFEIEVRIGDIFDERGAILISSNTYFEADVAGGKIASKSLQGQFTAKYFTGDQSKLIEDIEKSKKNFAGNAPYLMGATIPISTHGKTFYFTAMADLNELGNASTNIHNVLLALDGLWNHVKEAGELQELVVPVIGTGRGRLTISRKKMIGHIASSFVTASETAKFADKLVIVVRPEDASKFALNLYEVKDYLVKILHS